MLNFKEFLVSNQIQEIKHRLLENHQNLEDLDKCRLVNNKEFDKNSIKFLKHTFITTITLTMLTVMFLYSISQQDASVLGLFSTVRVDNKHWTN